MIKRKHAQTSFNGYPSFLNQGKTEHQKHPRNPGVAAELTNAVYDQATPERPGFTPLSTLQDSTVIRYASFFGVGW